MFGIETSLNRYKSYASQQIER